MLTYQLEQRGTASLYEYLYACIRNDIESGQITAHEKLPSKRSLAKHLGVSLITVEGAYTQLAAEGYLYSVERKGYFASPLSIEQRRARPSSEQQTARKALPEVQKPVTPKSSSRATARRQRPSIEAQRMASSKHLIADFTGSSSATGLFPYSTWAKTVREALTCESEQTLLGESSAAGSLRLRKTLAGYLKGFRGMQVEPEQIIIGAGAQLLYLMIVQLLGMDCRFAVEDPGYPRLTRIYRSSSVALSHVPMDEGGIVVDALRESAADIVHITPSHQFPTGLVMPISRRYELLGWANEQEGRYIVEDDYDCEFRLTGRPIPPLQAIDASERVIYVNTFAKSLGPAFRIGYMVLPPHLAERFAEELGFYSNTVSAIDQLALARFIENGDYERHINRMRSHYRTVQGELIDTLRSSRIADRLSIEAVDSGLHFILGIESEAPEAEVVNAAYDEGVALVPLSSFYQNGEYAAAQPFEKKELRRFVMSYSGIARETIAPAVEAIAIAVS